MVDKPGKFEGQICQGVLIYDPVLFCELFVVPGTSFPGRQCGSNVLKFKCCLPPPPQNAPRCSTQHFISLTVLYTRWWLLFVTSIFSPLKMA